MRLMNTPARLYNIQALRGIAVMLVVFLHMFATESKYSPDQILPAFLQVGAAGVDIFFVISGFIMVTVTSHTADQRHSAQHFLLSRATRIYPTYWLISLALLLIALFFPGIATPLANDWKFVLRSFLLYPQEHLPLLMVGWTLVHEMFFYVIFAGLLLLPARWRYISLVVWALLTAIGYEQLHPPVTEPELALLFNPLSLEFIAGCFVALLIQHVPVRFGGLWFFCGLLALVIAWTHWIHVSHDPLPTEMKRFYYFIVPGVLMTLGCAAMDQQGQHLSRWLEKLGDASYSIYLTHILILSSLCKAWQFFPYRDSWLDNAVFIPFTLTATLVGGMVFYHKIEQPLLLLTRQWIRRS